MEIYSRCRECGATTNIAGNAIGDKEAEDLAARLEALLTAAKDLMQSIRKDVYHIAILEGAHKRQWSAAVQGIYREIELAEARVAPAEPSPAPPSPATD